MVVRLHGLTLELRTDEGSIERAWKLLFDSELEPQADVTGSEAPVRVHARLADELPPMPPDTPHFADPAQGVTVFTIANGYLLYLGDEQRAAIHLDGGAGRLELVSRAGAEEHGRFEDVITMALAPILRRRGIYLIHAFAAVRPQGPEALLLVGASGSGKTTTGLALRNAGWQMLANDVAFLEQRDGLVRALPSPGTVFVTKQTLALLPELVAHQLPLRAQEAGHKLPLSRAGLLAQGGSARSTSISAIYFPRVTTHAETAVTPVPRAVGLARLLSASMDQWDRPTWTAHLALLAALAKQVRFFDLALGRDLDRVTAAINADMLAHA